MSQFHRHIVGTPTVRRVPGSGALEIHSLVGDALMRRTYMGYTRREALRLYRAERRELARETFGDNR